jgi:hypothetical protein
VIRRRAQQLLDRGATVVLEQLEREISERDRSDATRAVGPLVQPPKAIVLDTSELSFGAVVEELNRRFERVFGSDRVHAKLSDGILADAAAGGDTVKIKDGTLFSKRDIDILEVHEGWVHVGTTQNGNAQHVAKWLSKGPPRCSSTQEGLAVLMEIFTFRSYPRRARHINDRILGIEKAEEGASTKMAEVEGRKKKTEE